MLAAGHVDFVFRARSFLRKDDAVHIQFAFGIRFWNFPHWSVRLHHLSSPGRQPMTP
jgi:hypothetical protein